VTEYAEQTATEPTALAVTDEGTWVIAYRNDLGTPKLLRARTTAPAARSATTFVEVPLRPAD